MVETAVSTNQKPTMYRNLYENIGPGRYTAELPMRRIKLFFIPSKFALCAKYSHIVDVDNNPLTLAMLN